MHGFVFELRDWIEAIPVVKGRGAGNRLDIHAYRCVVVVARNRKKKLRLSFPVVSGCHPALVFFYDLRPSAFHQSA